MRVGTAAAALVGVVVVALVLLLSDGGDPSAGPPRVLPPAQPARGPANPPVVLLVLDEFPIDVIRTRNGAIDAHRYPNFARLAREGYWFPNATTVYDSTPRAVPTILSGVLPRKARRPLAREYPGSIYTMLGRRGYRIVDSEEATAMCSRSLCSNAHSAKGILRRLQQGRRERLDAWIDAIRPGRRRLYVKHALLPHVPWIFLPSGKQHRLGARDPVPGLASPPGFADPFLTKVNMLRQQLQIGFVDRKIGELIARLEQVGAWDDALVVVTADHGYSWQVGVDSRRLTDRSNVHMVAPVPLFVKAPRQRRGRTLRAYVRTVDVLPTIADLLGVKPGYPVDGRSAFSHSVRRRRSIRVILRDFSGAIGLRAAALERRRQAFIRRKLRLFGTGPRRGHDWRLYRGLGPHRELLGQNVASLPVREATRVRAGIATARQLADVDLASLVRPTHIAGTIVGGGRRERRAIAVAVNGRIEAVGRTFYLEGSARESFSVLVPEWVLRQGPNDVRVFEVKGRRGGLSLVALG